MANPENAQEPLLGNEPATEATPEPEATPPHLDPENISGTADRAIRYRDFDPY